MKNFQVTFKSHNASNPFVMFESENLKEALHFFNNANFEGFSSDELNAIEHEDDYSEIELRKLIDGEISEFEQNEEGLEINAGWITKEYSIN
jgi:hypothetical protein